MHHTTPTVCCPNKTQWTYFETVVLNGWGLGEGWVYHYRQYCYHMNAILGCLEWTKCAFTPAMHEATTV